jgi:uncharacterized protein with von Willebrand factor type A (vWA) domain
MAKQWKSLWDDSDDEGNGPDEAKQPRGPRPNPDYRGENDAAQDELASDEYGGYGWSGNFSGGSSGGSYRYDDAFDDSDSYWYRKNSFRYGKHADYSPSSLFRSAFSRSYSYGGDDNDAKNKAIRALRNLTRSANTIVDKAVGNNEFAIQFSSGTDSNGASEKLNDEKQRVVFVSPDELLAATTTEDEDAVVDALTGFVLLRVQMAQDVALNVIGRINRTNAAMAAVKIAAQFVKKGAKTLAERTTEELHGMSSAAVDEYLAGMLAKSVLMRLARRKVVQNWGGFAPYFIRHAKKFAEVKEHLEKAELSVESVVSTLGYNMLADEEPIAVDKALDEIAAKHLGEEVPMEKLLSACTRLVEDIRAALASSSEAVPGDMEAALNDMLDKAQAAQKAEGKGGSNPLKDFLEEFGKSLMDNVGAASDMLEDCNKADAKANELSAKLTAATSAEQLLKRLSEAIAKMSEMIEDSKSVNPAVAADGALRLMNTRNNIKSLLHSRPKGMANLHAGGFKPEADDIEIACNMSKGPITEADAKALRDKVEEFLEKASRFAKAQRETLKKETKESVAGMQERVEKAVALAETMRKTLADTDEKLAARSEIDEVTRAGVKNVLENLVNTFTQVVNNAARHKPDIDKHAASVNSARSSNTLEKAHKNARQFASASVNSLNHVSVLGYNWYAIPAVLQQMLRALEGLRGTMPNDAAVEMAVDEVLSKKELSPAGFAAAMARGAAGDAFDKFMDSYDDDEYEEDDEDEDDSDDEDDDEDDIDLRVDKATKIKIQQALENIRAAGLNASSAEALGALALEQLQEIQEESSPVDGELFGDTISAKTKILDSEAIGRVNDEARNDPEEEYIAYLNNANATKPKVKTSKEGTSSYRGSRAVVVKEVRSTHRGSIERVKNALQFQSGKRTAENFGLRSGDLDEGSLHKLGYDCDNIWSQKTISKLPDVAVGILVDQSGSMSGPKIESARTMCIILAEALKKIAGVRLYVYGHTANMGGTDLMIYEHYTPTNSDITNLGGIAAHCNNYDGYAIKDVAKRLALDTAKKKYLFVIADGLPSGHGYGGETAEKHVTSVCRFIRDRLKIGVNAFAVGVPNYNQTAFKRQYGDGHVVFINDIMKCLPQIVRFLRNTLQKERKLVGVES